MGWLLGSSRLLSPRIDLSASTVIKLTFLSCHYSVLVYLIEIVDEYILEQVGINLAEVRLETVKVKILGGFFARSSGNKRRMMDGNGIQIVVNQLIKGLKAHE